MKIQYLAVLFIIIIMPIIIVFNEYLNTQITIVMKEETYNNRLLNSTYDAIKALQINTINTSLYTPETRVSNMEAAVNAFYSSLSTAFKYDGYQSSVMKEYVPAVVFTLYDGYYIYSPFINTLTNKKNATSAAGNNMSVDEDYEGNTILNGLKPYVAYTCKYKKNGKEYLITYTMDNYITVDIFDGLKYETHEGYLLNGITKNGNSYIYDNIEFKGNDYEVLKECLYEEMDVNNKPIYKEYYYVDFDGTKYYYNGNANDGDTTKIASDDSIFYINNKLYRTKQVTSYKNNETNFLNYYNKIFQNNSAYCYYKDAFEFTNWVKTELGDLTKSNIESNNNYEFSDVGRIFDGNMQDADSNFNRHRSDVIRSVITTNLSTAITGFSKYSTTGEEFLMPKISEVDWENLENNICVVTFMQGLKVGGKTYNSYAVIANNFNKEYVDENDIYLIKSDNTYTKANDSTLDDSTIKTKNNIGYYAGTNKINFETRMDQSGAYYIPMSYKKSGTWEPYLLSYTSMAGTSKTIGMNYSDIYKYMRSISSLQVKKAYYTALAREKYGSYKFSK